ncbi:MAG: hypothetical protein HY721_05670, partial [Planctomycetes bacterium]|nr:hypothetical protein [Planctomycetota bacterium]
MRNHHGRLLAPAVCLLAAWGPQARSEEKERAPKAEKKEPKKGPGKGKTAVKSDVPIESLIEWNAAELFGNGKVTIRGEQVEVLCEKDGHVASAFEGTNIMDSRHEKMKGATRRFIQYGDQKDGEKLLPGLAAIAMGEGTWTSRFRLAGETRVSFDMRIPNLLTEQSTMKIRIGWDGSAGYETTFFNSIAFIASGIPKGLIAASDPKHKRHAFHWFQRGAEPVPVEFGIEGGQAVARYSRKDLVTIPKAKDRGGKVQISFK